MSDLGQATLLRAVWSRRQLFEVMVEFWSNHLNVTNPSSDVWDSRHDYDRNVIRKYALGKFSDMLWASATHPAMMRYLNNADSVPPDFNENYGRELLELHTVGVDAGYTEADMRSSALIMSGFGVHDPWPQDANTGHLRVPPGEPLRRARSPSWASATRTRQPVRRQGGRAGVRVLPGAPPGDRTPDRGQARHAVRLRRADAGAGGRAGDRRTSPTTPRSSRCCGSCSPAWSSARHQGTKVKRPLEDLVSTCRTMGITPDPGNGHRRAAGAVVGVRQPRPHAAGVADAQRLLRRRRRLAVHQPDARALEPAHGPGRPVVAGRERRPDQPGEHPMLQAPALSTLLPSPLPTTYGPFVDAMAQRLVYQKLAPAARAAVCAFLGKTPTSTLKSTDAAVGWKLPVRRGADPRLGLPRDALSGGHGRADAGTSARRATALTRTARVRGFTRRAFLRRSGFVAGAVGLMGGRDLATRLAFAAAPYTGDVLVVVSFRGGLDGLSAIVPRGDPDFAAPARTSGSPTGAARPRTWPTATTTGSACTRRWPR